MNSSLRVGARALIMKGEKALLMKREVEGRLYRTLIGGGVEKEDASIEECLYREVKEETNLSITNVQKVGEYEGIHKEKSFYHHIYVAEYEGGEAEITGVEKERITQGNYYELVWVLLQDIATYDIKPEESKQLILDYLRKNKKI